MGTRTAYHPGPGAPLTLLFWFWMLFLAALQLAPAAHDLIRTFVVMRSEYNVYEQLSKYYIFIVILVCIHAYRRLKEPIAIKTSVCFLMLALSLYLGESNMIADKARSLFGALFFASLFYFLFRSRSWLAFALMGASLGILGMGAVADRVIEHEWISSTLPAPLLAIFSVRYEELFDVVGLAFFCASAIVFFFEDIMQFVADNVLGTILLLLCSGLITAGDGLLHYQYHPDMVLATTAFLITGLGLLGFVATNARIVSSDRRLTLLSREIFYFFLFVFFVVLPVVYGGISSVESVLLWLPALVFAGVYLYRRHPAIRAAATGQSTLHHQLR